VDKYYNNGKIPKRKVVSSFNIDEGVLARGEHIIEAVIMLKYLDIFRADKKITRHKNPTLLIFYLVGGQGFHFQNYPVYKRKNPKAKIISVEPLRTNTTCIFLQISKIVEKDYIDILVDGLAKKKSGEKSFQLVKNMLMALCWLMKVKLKKQ